MELRDYQREDVEFFKAHHVACDFSEQRTGKTYKVCAYIQEENIGRALIVCPKSVVYVWQEALLTFSDITAGIVTDADYAVKPEDRVLIVNYELLRGKKNVDNFNKWKPELLVVDEAHRCKNWKSLTYKAIDKLSRYVPRRLYLTGTPVTNKQYDIWVLLHFLDRNMWGSPYVFLDKFFMCEQIRVAGGRTVNTYEFWKPGAKQLVQSYLSLHCVQRKRKEVMPWLEETTVTKIKLPATKQQIVACRDLEQYYEHKHIITQNVLENLIRTRQILNDPYILGLKGKSPKAVWLSDYVKDYPEKTILVCSHSKQFLSHLSELNGWPVFSGDTDAAKRKDLIAGVQSGNIKVLLAQTVAISEGITLSNVDVTIMLDNYCPFSVYLQAKDRMVATSIEENKPKELIEVMIKDSFDEALFGLVARRCDEAAVINSYKEYLERNYN